MKSLSKIMKAPKEEHKIRPYDFFSGFTKEAPVIEIEEEAGEELPEETKSYQEILDQAKQQAEGILNDAREQAEMLREQAYQEGLEEGREAGIKEAYEEQRSILDEEVRNFQTELSDVLSSVSVEKEKLIEKSIDNLKEISITVAEKIIRTSIRSSGDIIKRMILAAADKMKKHQWAKIYVTKCNAEVSLEVDTEFLEALSHLSDNIKISTIDDGEEGTCILELPDEIVDASVSTQLENIKDVINNAKM